MAYGSSYGGYIALLLGKFAPHTFSAIIDNSGFSRASVIDICTREYKLGSVVYRHEGVTIQAIADEPWTLSDELDPNYFSESCRSIRSLLEESHRIPSDTSYYIFHGDEDKVCPTSEKEQVVEILRKYNLVNFKKVTADDIDGRVFKDLSHGMKASLRGVFDLVQEAGGKLQKSEDLTDFDRSSVHTFACGTKTYSFSYSNDHQIRVEILN
jgi:predicted peptidase